MASPNPLDSRFRGNDGQKIGGNGAIIVHFSLMSTRPSHWRTPMSPSQEIEARVVRQLESLGAEYEMFEIDPDFADTAAFCEKYGFPPENSGNTIIVASKRGAKKHCACIVAATDRLDVNKRVKRLMEVSRASFAGADETAELTGMMIGGVTPFGLPSDLPIYADAKLKGLDYVILGGGSRSSKIKIPPAEMEKLPSLQFVEGLSLVAR